MQFCFISFMLTGRCLERDSLLSGPCPIEHNNSGTSAYMSLHHSQWLPQAGDRKCTSEQEMSR